MNIRIATVFVVFVLFPNSCLIQSLRNEFIGDCLYHFNILNMCRGCFYYNTREEDIITFTCSNYTQPNNFFESSIMKCSNSDALSLYNRNAGTMRFQNCQMPRIKYNIFGVFTKVHTLNITGIELQLLPKEFFTGASQLKTLIVSNNRLLEIPSSQFREVPALIEADYSFNRISEISEDAFHGATAMKKLNLSHNYINSLQTSTLAKLSSIATIDLSFNQIKTFVNSVIKVIPELRDLSLSYNKLTNLTIGSMPKLEFLSLSHNYLANLTIVGMWNLQFLSLSYNNFTYFDMGTLSALKKLEFLDLSHNLLKRIDFGVSRLNHLETLYINDNRLRDMDGFKNTLLPTLTSFSMSSNRFECSYLEKFLDVFERHSSLDLLIRDEELKINQTEHRHGITCFKADASVDSTVEPSSEISTVDYSDQQSTTTFNPTSSYSTEQLPAQVINFKEEKLEFNYTEGTSIAGNEHAIHHTIKNLLIVLCVMCGIILSIIIVRLFRRGESMNYYCAYNRGLGQIQTNITENQYEAILNGKSGACTLNVHQ